MERRVDKVSFFASFYDAASDLAAGDRLAFYDACFGYAFDGEEPAFEGVMGIIWKLVRPNIDSSIKGQRAGGKGGRPKSAKPPVSDGGNPPFRKAETPAETPAETNMDKDMDRDRDRDRDREEFVPLERTNSSSDGEAAAPAAAEAAPPPRDGPDASRAPHCPLCDSLLRFNVESGRWSCSCVGDVKDGSVVWR